MDQPELRAPWFAQGQGRKKQQFQVPVSVGIYNGPIDGDLKSVLETPLDYPSEGDDLREETVVSGPACFSPSPSALAGGWPGCRALG